jgi:hypothetical protein
MKDIEVYSCNVPTLKNELKQKMLKHGLKSKSTLVMGILSGKIDEHLDIPGIATRMKREKEEK